MANWYSRGQKGLDEAKQRRESSQRPSRIWIPKGKSKELIFLDDESFNVWEYNWKTDMRGWRNWATMPEDADVNALFIQRGLRAGFTAFYTVINCTEYEDNQGRKHNFVLQLLPAKEKTAAIIEELKETLDGGLKGKLFKAKRFEDGRTLSAGDMYTFVREVDLSKVYGNAEFMGNKFPDLVNQANEDPEKMDYLQAKFQVNVQDGKVLPELVPFNYFEILKPPTAKEAKQQLASMTAGGSGSSGGQGEAEGEDNVPF